MFVLGLGHKLLDNKTGCPSKNDQLMMNTRNLEVCEGSPVGMKSL